MLVQVGDALNRSVFQSLENASQKENPKTIHVNEPEVFPWLLLLSGPLT